LVEIAPVCWVMSEFKLLIDTNVVIGLEDWRPVDKSFAELVRLSNEYGVGLFVDPASYDDVYRDKDLNRQEVTLSKLAKFQKLREIPLPKGAELGPINNDNDRCDVRLLAAIQAKATDFLVTQDVGLHRRAARADLGARVLTVEDAVQWLRQTFRAQKVDLPYVIERIAYEIDRTCPMFDGLRADYPGFDDWFDKCARDHRICWTLEVGDQLAGLIIRKDEKRTEADIRSPGNKILKICTFKVRDEYLGEKFGELLLKAALWFAQRNGYDVAYLTAFPKHDLLIELLSYYGFVETMRLVNGEIKMEKPFLHGELPPLVVDAFDFDRLHYPRFQDGPEIRKFCIPIRPSYHQTLFPEIAYRAPLPLFPESYRLVQKDKRIPGNTIRKVYLSGSRTMLLRPGDIILFYMSKDLRYARSQCLTTVGIVEQVRNVTDAEELIRLTAKRSVYSADDLRRDWNPSIDSPTKLIDFLLIGHIEPPLAFEQLLNLGTFTHPPRTIMQLSESAYLRLRPHIKLGTEF